MLCLRVLKLTTFRKYPSPIYFQSKTLHSSARMSGAATSASLYLASVTVSSNSKAVPEDARDKKHHLKDDAGFNNPWESWINRPGFSIGLNMIRRRITGKANVPDTQASSVPPVQNASFLPSRLTGQAPIRATWLGHACYHVEFASGLRVLFDPVFSDRCSPFSWLGPKRYTKVPCQIEDIPFIDAVMISHNHYDHCDQPTLERIAKTHTNAHFFVPLKNKELITSFGIQADRVTELDWWEEATLELSTAQEKSTVSKDTNASTDQGSGKIVARIGALPCQHMGNRGLTDRGKTLWSSWSVETGGKKLWFGGDTGYRAVPDLPDSVDDYGEGHDYPRCPAFAEIGRHRGPFDLGLIPIGAYQPRFVMSPMHGNPEDAVNIFQDTKCKRAMAIHWGTWVLTEEDVLEPPQRLKVALKKYGLPETGTFDVCDIGESREFN